MEQAKQNRIIWLDILRVLSALAVVCIHVCTNFLDKLLPYGGANWFFADFYTAFARFAVPIFVMISGVFFLNPDKHITTRDIYRKYIFRMLTVLLGWAAVRTIIIDIGLNSAPPEKWAMCFFTSIKMFWFLPMIIGLYIFTPVLRGITVLKNRSLLKYFMTVTFIFALCAPVLEVVELYFFPKAIPLSDFTNLIKLTGLLFGAHFVFGYYAYNFELSKNSKNILYACAVLSVILMAAGTYAFFNEKTSRLYYYAMHGSSLSPLTFILGAGIFVFAKDKLSKISFSDTTVAFIQKLAYYSLGVYLLHIIIVETAVHFGLFKPFNFAGALTAPLITLLIFALANAIISVLYKVPWIRKYFL